MANNRLTPGSPDRTVRDRLLEVAAQHFARKGFSATTIREIVSAAGVTKPVLYYYFQNKEGIYLELIRQAFKEYEEVVDASVADLGDTEEKLLSLCTKVLALALEKIGVVRLMYSIYYGPPQGAPFFDFDAVHQKLFEAIQQVVTDGILKKEVRRKDAGDVTWAIMGAINITVENELTHPERRLGHEGLVRILRLIFQGILREGNNKGTKK